MGLRTATILLVLGLLFGQSALGCQAFDTPIRIQRCPSGEVQVLSVLVVKNNDRVRGSCLSAPKDQEPRFTLQTPCDVSTNFTLPILGDGEQLLFRFDRTQGKASYCETCAEGTSMNKDGQCSLQGPPPCQAQEVCNNQEDDDCDGQVDEDCRSVREPLNEPVTEVSLDAGTEAISEATKEVVSEPSQDQSGEQQSETPPESLGDGKQTDGGEQAGESISDGFSGDGGPQEANSLPEEQVQFEQKNDPTAERVLEKPNFGEFGSINPDAVSNDVVLRPCTKTSQCPINHYCPSSRFCRKCSAGQKDCNRGNSCGAKWPNGCNTGFACILSECYPSCKMATDCKADERCMLADSHSNRACATLCDLANGTTNNPACPASYFCTKPTGISVSYCFHVKLP